MPDDSGAVTALHITGATNPHIVHGFALTDPYIEACWTSALGPTAVLVARRLGFSLDHQAEYRVDAADFARSLGVGVNRDGPGVGATSPLVRAIGRLERFGFLTQRRDGNDARLLVWREVPGLSAAQRRRAPESTLALHQALTQAHLRQAVTRPVVEPAVAVPVSAVKRLRRPAPPVAVRGPVGMGR